MSVSPIPVETLSQPDGRRASGRMVFDAALGIGIKSDRAEKPVRLAPGAVVTCDGPGPDPASGYPPFRLELGLGQRISGRLGSIDATSVRLTDGPGGKPVVVARAGVQAVVQRLGEVQVLYDGFEVLEETRWGHVGDPEVVKEPRLVGERSVRVPAGGTSLTCRLPESVGSGRLEVAFHDHGVIAPGHQCFVDLTFRGAKGPETIRAVLGWAEESLAIESTGGPALSVQRLARKVGWHRLSVRFGPDQTEVAVDGNELAHGKGPSGPLVEIRLASHATGRHAAPSMLFAYFDDLRLARFSEPAGRFDVDPAQDEVRLVDGDQLFGALRSADNDHVVLGVLGKDVRLSWGEVSGLYFRRAAAQGQPTEGPQVRLEWRAAPGNDPSDLDQVEGSLTTLSDSTLTLATPYAGVLTIPRNRLKRLRVLGNGRRIVIDPTAHHLGNEISATPPLLDPPQPEGGMLERTFALEKVPPGAAALALDVVQVVGELSGSPFSQDVKNGGLRTNVKVNGQFIDYLNRHITSKNETPERIRLSIPAGLLHAGWNRLRIEQTGRANDPQEYDDLGVLGIALECDAGPAAGLPTEKP
jgi:hypothetical protein